MFTVWICIECLHRILKSSCSEQNDRLVSSVETEESVKKEKNFFFCVKRCVKYKCFQIVTV